MITSKPTKVQSISEKLDLKAEEKVVQRETSLEMNLIVFHDIISQFSNPVIGGSHSLKLHGLNVGRKIEDLDIILYGKISQKELDFIELLRENDTTHSALKEIPAEYRRVIKVQRVSQGQIYKLDILLEKSDIPTGLLTYTSDRGILFPVQSISNVIEAKLGYGPAKVNGVHGDPKEYLSMRRKDIKDLNLLKVSNFNIFTENQ